jgi:signal peptidase I
MAIRGAFRRSLVKAAFLVILAASLLAGLVRAACLSGWLRPVRIAGGSMAETLLGDHWRIRCPICGFQHQCDVEQLPRDHRVECPNCGSAHHWDVTAAQVVGQRVLVDRWPSIRGDWRQRRGAVVAVRRDDAPSGFAVKRLIGLPGETISIRHGDVWLGPDTLYRKSWDELMAVAVPVHDDRFRASSNAERIAGWRPNAADSAWNSLPHGYRWDASGRRSSGIDWLAFRPAAGGGAIRDFDAYNQALSRRMEAVDDLLVCLDVVLDDLATLVLVLRPARSPGVRFEFSRSDGCRISVLDGETPRLVKRESLPVVHGPGLRRRIGVAHCDRQALVAIHNRELARVDLSTESSALAKDSRIVDPSAAAAIGASGGRVEISAVWLARDIHYSPASAPNSPQSWRLGNDEWFVLGDNAAASTDSRDWKGGSVRTGSLVGVVRPL